jgi:hypothetical protein
MKQIGKGSGRKVFDLENGFVLKQWYTEWGKQQNINEANIYNLSCDKYKKYLAISKISENYNVIMEKLTPIDKETFVEQVKHQEFYHSLILYLTNDMNLNNDIQNYSSWGINKQGQYVLLDYGYTHELYNDFMWEYTREPKYLDANYIEW